MYDIDQYKWLYLTSCFPLVVSVYAFFRGYPIISFLQFSIYLSSINFWRLPDYSWRRYVDFAVVKLCILYQNIYLVAGAENARAFYGIFSVGVLAYALSFYFHAIGKIWFSVYVHIFMHTLSALGCIYLYTGAIPLANSLLI